MADVYPDQTVLTVDDEPGVLRAIKRTLRPLGCRIHLAESGAEALEILRQETISVVITDMRMPGMSGAELLARIATGHPETRRILLTGQSDIEDTISAVNDGGISAFIAKPWDDERLRQVIRGALDQAALSAEKIRLERELEQKNAALAELNQELEAKVARRTAQLQTTNDQLTTTVDELSASYETMVVLLARLAALRDRQDDSILEEKVRYCDAMGEVLELPEDQRLALHFAARLHRIGRVALPDPIFDKPQRTLTAAERADYEVHPLYAEALLLAVPKLNHTARILRSQHERFDGQGFPDRLLRDHIPLESRILCVVRDYLDLVGGWFETKAKTPKDAVAFIQSEAGSRYDPEIATAFIQLLPRLSAADIKLAELRLAPRQLQPDMVLSRDLVTPQGMVLLHRGHQLTEHVIERLINLSENTQKDLQVYVRKPES